MCQVFHLALHRTLAHRQGQTQDPPRTRPHHPVEHTGDGGVSPRPAQALQHLDEHEPLDAPAVEAQHPGPPLPALGVGRGVTQELVKQMSAPLPQHSLLRHRGLPVKVSGLGGQVSFALKIGGFSGFRRFQEI